MTEHLSHIQRILEVYLNRGEEALRCYQERKIEAFLEHLKKRRAAFYNLRSLLGSQSVLDDEQLKILVRRIVEGDVRLKHAISDLKGDLSEQMMKIGREKARIASFRSGLDSENRFTRNV